MEYFFGGFVGLVVLVFVGKYISDWYHKTQTRVIQARLQTRYLRLIASKLGVADEELDKAVNDTLKEFGYTPQSPQKSKEA
jgi:hypothetical protein